MRGIVELLTATFLLGCCLWIRWPKGSVDLPVEAIGWVSLNAIERGLEIPSEVYWLKTAENQLELFNHEQASSKEILKPIMTWLNRAKFYTNNKGDVLISKDSQLWSRHKTEWKSWLIRDGLELESAQWMDSIQKGVWKLNWRKKGENIPNQFKIELLDRNLKNVTPSTF